MYIEIWVFVLSLLAALLVGGLIGSMVLTWRLLMAGKYLLKSIGYGGLWIVKKVFRT